LRRRRRHATSISIEATGVASVATIVATLPDRARIGVAVGGPMPGPRAGPASTTTALDIARPHIQ
jgi:hypothetical protein